LSFQRQKPLIHEPKGQKVTPNLRQKGASYWIGTELLLPCPTAFLESGVRRTRSEEIPRMKKVLIALLTAASLVAAVTVPDPADASSSRRFWQGVGIGVGAAVVGGALFGAAARASLAPAYQPYAPVEGYYYYPTYAGAVPVGCPNGFWAAKVVGVNQFGQPVYGKPRWICPPAGYTQVHYIYR
jgi:hypothetical protein